MSTQEFLWLSFVLIDFLCRYTLIIHNTSWGFIKKPGLSVTYSWQIGFWEHDIEALKMQGRARGRKGERKTYHNIMFCEKTESDRKSLWRKIRARQNGAGAGSPCPARSFKRISYKKRLLINLGLIVALPPMTARSQATATKFLAFLLRFTKKIWFWLQHAKVPGILHAMNGICWNPHARKSAQGRSARGPNIPKSYRNFRQPPVSYAIFMKKPCVSEAACVGS